MKSSGRFSSAKLVLARREKGLTQGELAARMARSRNAVVLWESGRFAPEEENVNKLSEVLNKPVAYFFEQENHEMRESRAEYGAETGRRPSPAALSDNTLTLPLLAGIPESLPGYAEKDIESFAHIPRYLFPGADFMIRCGEENSEAGVNRDDLCVIRKISEVIPGKLLLAKTEKGFSIVRAPEKGGKAPMHPGALVIGEVLGVWKSFK